MIRLFSLVLISCLFPLLSKAQRETVKTDAKLSADGPYIVYDSLGTGATITSVDIDGNIQSKHYDYIKSNESFHVTTTDGKYSFDVQLHSITRPQWNYPQPERIFITSDPHGNFDCLYNLLYENGIIDKDCNWTYSAGHFVLIGDVMDRGKDVLPIYWLLYKLEAQAAQAGGAVHFLLGNHEAIVLSNDNRYTEGKYTSLAYKMGVNYNYFLSPLTELGRWILSRNTIERIGRNIIVHGGVSRELYDKQLSIPEINTIVPIGLYQRKKERKATGKNIAFLSASNGPLWYRGLVKKVDKYNPISSDTLNMILERYDADRVIVGHTIHKDVISFHEGRVIGVNVDNEENRKKNRTRALLMEHDSIYTIKNNGIRDTLKQHSFDRHDTK